jgi:hypothetical protein
MARFFMTADAPRHGFVGGCSLKSCSRIGEC